MKSVLFIAYIFPPLGGGGVLRSVKFVKYLRRKGWKVHVLTVRVDDGFVHDERLIEDIPDGVMIHRSSMVPLEKVLSWCEKVRLGFVSSLLSRVVFPDLQVGWLPSAFLRAGNIIEDEKIDVVYTTSSPFTSHFVGMFLKRRYPAVRWVSDYRDPWSQNAIMYRFLGPSRKRIDAVFEKVLLDRSDEIIVSTESNRKNLIERFRLPEGKVSTVTNGYDEDDFSAIPPHTQGDEFTITYIGSAYSTYNPANFIQAALPLLKSKLRIKLRFVGECAGWVHDYLRDKSLHGPYFRFFELVDHVHYRDALSAMIRSDLLLLVLPSDAASIIPGKIFEYIRSGVPVFAAIPAGGDAAEIITKTRTGMVVDPDEIDEMTSALRDCYTRWKEGTLDIVPDHARIRRYDRDLLTDRLTGIFNRR